MSTQVNHVGDMSPTPAASAMVRFGRRQSKGVLLGLSGPRLACVGAAIAVLALCSFLFGAAGLALSAPVWVGLVAVSFVRWQGAPIAEQAGNVAHWQSRQVTGQTQYRVALSKPRAAGTMALPGDAAALRFHLHEPSGAVMVHDPHRGTLSAIVRVYHPAYVLLSADEQARRVAAWSRVLASLAATGSCAGLQVLESTLPDPGHGVREWYAAHGVHDGSWSARQYDSLMGATAPTSYTHRTLVTLSLDMRRAAKPIRDAGRGIAAAAAVLFGDMTTMSASLRAADLSVEGWLNPSQLAAVIRQAYDPELDARNMWTPLSTAGPVSLDEHWDHLRHDSAYSAVLWISEWPRIDVAPHFLHSLMFLQHVRKSVSLVAKPLATGEALRSIRKEKVEYLTDAAQSARIGKIADLSVEQEYLDVLARERALVAGHADLRFSGFVAITAGNRDELTAAMAAAERAASQCGCETRVLFGQQAQAFTVAALPLGRQAQ